MAEPETNISTSVFIIQQEALDRDEEIRKQILEHGFVIKEQAVLNLTRKRAQAFVALSQVPENENVEETASSGSLTARSNKSEKSVKKERIVVGDSPGEAIEALCRGPIVAMVLAKENAVAELLKLVGSPLKENWEAEGTTLRAQFGVDQGWIGVRSSINESVVSNERDFLFSNARGDSSATAIKTSASKKNHKVSMDSLLKFLFPPQMQHPKSIGRLFVFALYGPLDEKSRLRSGEKGLHVVSDLELDTMCRRIEREDILSVYSQAGLTAEEEEEIIKQADRYLKVIPQFKPEHVKKILRRVPRDGDNNLSFHDMQRVILAERDERVRKMKQHLDLQLTEEITLKLRKHRVRNLPTTYNHPPKCMFRADEGMNNSQNAVHAAKLLNSQSFKICDIENGNSPALTQNVRLLREEIDDGKNRNPWKN